MASTSYVLKNGDVGLTLHFVIERRAQEKLAPVYTKRRNVVKGIPKFWPVALMNHNLFAIHAQHNADQHALSYLEDLWITRDAVETRCFVLEFVSVLCVTVGRAAAIDRTGWVCSISKRTHTSRTVF